MQLNIRGPSARADFYAPALRRKFPAGASEVPATPDLQSTLNKVYRKDSGRAPGARRTRSRTWWWNGLQELK